MKNPFDDPHFTDEYNALNAALAAVSDMQGNELMVMGCYGHNVARVVVSAIYSEDQIVDTTNYEAWMQSWFEACLDDVRASVKMRNGDGHVV